MDLWFERAVVRPRCEVAMSSRHESGKEAAALPRHDACTTVPDRVRAAARSVIEQAKDVRIDSRRVPELVHQMEQWHQDSWIHASPVRFDHLQVEDQLKVGLLFNAISFCYWPAPWWDNDWYECGVRRGSWALLAAIRHAIDTGIPVLVPAFLMSLAEDDLAAILNGRGRLALLTRRAEILREVGSVLEDSFGGTFLRLVETAAWDAPRIVAAIQSHFPSFKDEACLEGKPVPFAKRAQLLAADCHRIFERGGDGLLRFESLTACADYMIPALLARAGVLVYSAELQKSIDRQVPLTAGERQEVEIRSATVVACDLLAESWGRTAMQVNDALWVKAGDVFAATPAHHRAWTEAY